MHTVKGFSIVNKTEVDIFLELSCLFNGPTDVGNLSLASLPFLNIIEHLKVQGSCTVEAGLENFEHYFASM